MSISELLTKFQTETNLNNQIQIISRLIILDPKNSLKYAETALNLDNTNVDALNNFAFLLHQHQNYQLAIIYYKKCLNLYPTYTLAYRGIINLFNEINDTLNQKLYLEKGIRYCSKDYSLYNQLAIFYTDIQTNSKEIIDGLYSKALFYCNDEQETTKVLVNIAHTESIFGDYNKAIDIYLQILEKEVPKNVRLLAVNNLLLDLHYVDFNSIKTKLNIQANSLEQLNIQLYNKQYKPVQIKSSSRIKNLCFISNDLSNHPVENFITVIFKYLDKKKYNIFLYSNKLLDENSVKKFKECYYSSISNVSTQTVLQMLKNDQIDLIFDLSGHTSGNRLDVIAKTDIQKVHFIGYPNIVGNYPVIVDTITNPTESNYYLRMPKCFLCYTPNIIIEPLLKPKDAIYYGCLARVSKINAELISIWIQILNKTPNSFLILKSRIFGKSETKLEWLKKYNINKTIESKLILLDKTGSPKEHLENFNKINVHLDTQIYSGTTISCESLYLNTPVITLKGFYHVSRVTSSILTCCNLKELIAENWEEYIEKAIYYGKNPIETRTLFIKHMMNYKEYIKDFTNILDKLL